MGKVIVVLLGGFLVIFCVALEGLEDAQVAYMLAEQETSGLLPIGEFRVDQAGGEPSGTLLDIDEFIGVAPVYITPTSPPNGEINVFYELTLRATGGSPPYTWVVVSGNLPDGLSLNSSTGVISGEPVTEGMFNFNVGVQDGLYSDTEALRITVLAPGEGGSED